MARISVILRFLQIRLQFAFLQQNRIDPSPKYFGLFQLTLDLVKNELSQELDITYTVFISVESTTSSDLLNTY